VTTPKQLAIHGRSNGGLLVGACVLQRPDLFGAAVATVGVLDMLRFHRFTIGYAWCGDYGNAEKSKQEFQAMYRYSPLHQAARMKNNGQTIPALLITTADHDDRVVPLHSFKFAAQVQDSFGSNPAQTAPLIARIEADAGHGAGKPTHKVIDEYCDIAGFIAHHTGAVFIK
jgi:prolyl oligopeptidase